jgi:hypothetical protein
LVHQVNERKICIIIPSDNTSTPLRCEKKTQSERKAVHAASSSINKPPPRYKQNGSGTTKKNLSSVSEFDKEELSNILSQDSFGDFSQMEGH